MVIAQRVRQRPAPHVVAAIAALVHTPTRPTPRPTRRREAARVAETAGAGIVEA
jgi:hypothetical protein